MLTFGGPSRGGRCQACAREIPPGALEWDLVAPTMAEIRVDADCYALFTELADRGIMRSR